MYVHVIWCSQHLVGAVWILSLVRNVGCALLLTMKGWGCLFSFTCRFSFSLVSWTFRPLIPSSTFFQLALRIKAHSQKSASCVKSAIWIKLPCLVRVRSPASHSWVTRCPWARHLTLTAPKELALALHGWYHRRCVNVCMNGWMLGNIVKRFGWPLVTKKPSINAVHLPSIYQHINNIFRNVPGTLRSFSVALGVRVPLSSTVPVGATSNALESGLEWRLGPLQPKGASKMLSLSWLLLAICGLTGHCVWHRELQGPYWHW